MMDAGGQTCRLMERFSYVAPAIWLGGSSGGTAAAGGGCLSTRKKNWM